MREAIRRSQTPSPSGALDLPELESHVGLMRGAISGNHVHDVITCPSLKAMLATETSVDACGSSA